MLTSLLTVVAAAAIAAPTPAPQWESDYGKALAQARNDDKPLLVVIESADQQLDASLTSVKGNATLKKYDLCRVDASTEYGQKVAEAFGAEQMPFVAFIDKQGSVVLHTQEGDLSKDAFRASLVKYQDGKTAQQHVVLKPATQSYPVEYQPASNYYQSPGYCPSCQKGF